MDILDRPITFAKNLKHYRVQHAMTQKQLADQLGYTEKSVSKWESGNGLPPVELLLQLANIFHVSLDELLFGEATCRYFLGIDGGGTKTEFKLVDENGNTVNQVCKGATNPNDTGMEKAMSIWREGIRQVCQGIPYGQIVAFAGLSGGGLTGENGKIIQQFMKKIGFLAFDNGSDVENLVALADQTPCILVIMGTGFIAYALSGKKKKRISGWGQLFDEGGCGYTLGRDAITAVLCAADGTARPTQLTTLMTQRLGETAAAHLSKFYQGGKRYIATFADLVFQAAANGDGVAQEILEKNMVFVAQRVQAAANYLKSQGAEGKIRVLFSGGISKQKDALFPLVEKNLPPELCQLVLLEEEPVEGAIKRAQAIYKEYKVE